MLSKTELTERQKEILNFITDQIEGFGFPPTISEIQNHFSFSSPNSVEQHLKALAKKGCIKRHPHKSRGIEIINALNERKSQPSTVAVPLVGRIAAGSPLLAEENIEGTIFVDKYFVRNSQGMFVLRVKGTSMINAGILDGDFVLVRQQPTAEQGEMVVALIEDEATVKRFYREKNKIRLQPENDTMKPIIVVPKESNIRIIGKVEGVIRKI